MRSEARGRATDATSPIFPRTALRLRGRESHLAERAARANIPKALGILKRAGVGRPPMKGDE
jgi:hypothetical protein